MPVDADLAAGGEAVEMRNAQLNVKDRLLSDESLVSEF